MLSNTKETIQIKTDEELQKIVQGIADGDKIIITKFGLFNPSYLVSIVPDSENYHNVYQHLNKDQYKTQQYEDKTLVSPFAKALSGSMKMLSDSARTKVDEEVSKEERRLKS